MNKIVRALVVGTVAATLVGCHAGKSHPGAWRLSQDGLAVEVLGAVDRVTYFGPAKGPNLLHLERLDEGPTDDGSYRFFGGVYTWVSPQDGWFDETGEPGDWPPDPAMDVGPVRRTSGSRGQVTVTGPMQRSGLVEVKTIRMIDSSTAQFEFAVRNDGVVPVRAGAWTLAAAGKMDLIAVRMPEGTEVWGADEAVEQFQRIRRRTNKKTGWALVKPWRARWKGGIKVYLMPPEGEPAQIAVCHKGFWFYRRVEPLNADERARLLASGEGPIALYIQPGRKKGEQRIVEVELYGPIEELDPGESVTTTETWRVIKAKGRRTRVLP